jgi:hypothetical protein
MSRSGALYVQARNLPVNVKDFGALGNGVTDDSAAIQAAFTYADSVDRAIYIPGGDYIIGTTLTPPSGMMIQGDGYKLTRLRRTTDTPIVDIIGDHTAASAHSSPPCMALK